MPDVKFHQAKFFDYLVETYILITEKIIAGQRRKDRSALYATKAADFSEEAQWIPRNVGIVRNLMDAGTKRLIFDSRQAAVFDDLGHAPEPVMQSKLQMPFEQMYIEFTEPILLSVGEPGRRDFMRALFIHPVQHGRIQVIAFLTNHDLDHLVDRAFIYDLPTGSAIMRVDTATSEGSKLPEHIEDDYLAGDTNREFVCEGLPDTPGRVVGWLETVCMGYASLVSWILGYMMAKSIVIETQHVSRQQRRAAERKGAVPAPWHLVMLEPRFTQGVTGADDSGKHGHRYDVIGHLRMGRHRKGDGTYSNTIEWVSPHQRGLEHELYIPKTIGVREGHRQDPDSAAYFRGER